MIKRLTVAGVGSFLSCDDAIGLRLVEAYARQPLPSGVTTQPWEDADALTLADNLLESDEPLLLVDCADMGLTAGSWRVFAGDEARFRCHSDALSTHGLGVAEALAIARELGREAAVHLFGVQPFDLSPRPGLSDGMQECFAALFTALSESVDTILNNPLTEPANRQQADRRQSSSIPPARK